MAVGAMVIPVGTMVETAAVEAKVGKAVVVVFGEVETKVVIVLRARLVVIGLVIVCAVLVVPAAIQ